MSIGKRAKKNNKKIRIIFVVFLTLIFILAILYLTIYFYNSNKNRNLYENLKRYLAQGELSQINSTFVEKVKELQQENIDVKGWIIIEGTNINYPLLRGTDNNFYMAHNYKKQESKHGSIMINSNSDLKDVNSNVIIYGHDMKDGQMFQNLLKYEDKEFYNTHSIIKIATDEEELEYQIIYIFKSRVFYKDERNVFKYYQHYNFKSESEYNEYLDNCRKIQLYDTGVTARYGEQLITLITCEYSQKNSRMVIVAKRK